MSLGRFREKGGDLAKRGVGLGRPQKLITW